MSRIEQYFTEKRLKPNTKKIYAISLKAFFEHIYGENAKFECEDLAEKYLTEGRDYKKDLMGYINSMDGRPPLSVRTYYSCVMSFLKYNEVEIKASHLIQIQLTLPRGHRSVSRETELTKEILQSLFAHTTLKSRALFLTVLSSGARIGEVLQLEVGDIKFDSDPVEIYFSGKYTKNGQGRLTFISHEAAQAVREWMKERNSYIQKRNHCEEKAVGNKMKRHFTVEQYHGKLFPFTYRNAKTMWTRMVDKAGFGRTFDDQGDCIGNKNRDKATGRAMIHIHMLRKYFRTYIAAVQIEGVNTLDAVEVLMGHEGYLTQSYRRLPESVLRTFYRGAEHAVTINTTVVRSGSRAQDQELLQIKRQLDLIMDQRVKPSIQESDFSQLKNNPAFQQWLKREFLVADGDAADEYGGAEGERRGKCRAQ